jgi:hypothetical protein
MLWRLGEMGKDIGKIIILCFGTTLIASIAGIGGCQMTGAPMGEGERLYRAKCTSCHQPVDPGTRTADQWRMRLDNHGPKLMDAERATMLRYLAQRCREASDVAVSAAPETNSACHPDQSRTDWITVDLDRRD